MQTFVELGKQSRLTLDERAIMPIVDGNPDDARGGGKGAGKLDEALARAK